MGSSYVRCLQLLQCVPTYWLFWISCRRFLSTGRCFKTLCLPLRRSRYPDTLLASELLVIEPLALATELLLQLCHPFLGQQLFSLSFSDRARSIAFFGESLFRFSGARRTRRSFFFIAITLLSLIVVARFFARTTVLRGL